MTDLSKFKDSVESVAELLALLEKMKIDHYPRAHVRFWFRGQAQHGWPLKPKIYRFFKDDKTRLRFERWMNQDFRVMSAGIRNANASDAELYFLQQHYGMPTRLLDWTHSPLAALYFAAGSSGALDQFDAELFMIDATALTPSGMATSRREAFLHALDGIARFRPEKHREMILPIRPDHFDRRIGLQRSSFTFHGPTKKTLAPVHSVRIPGAAKASIRRQLSVAAIDHFSVFGDLDSLSKRLIDAYVPHTGPGKASAAPISRKVRNMRLP
jgi:hypothetical protein